jgi:hypothetical protein
MTHFRILFVISLLMSVGLVSSQNTIPEQLSLKQRMQNGEKLETVKGV